MQSLIIWMIVGMADLERETAQREMRRWSEPRAIVITGIFRHAACEHKANEVFHVPTILSSKEKRQSLC